MRYNAGMKICAVALNTVWKDPKANIAKTEQCVKEAKQLFPETQVMLFPELSMMETLRKTLPLEKSFRDSYHINKTA